MRVRILVWFAALPFFLLPAYNALCKPPKDEIPPEVKEAVKERFTKINKGLDSAAKVFQFEDSTAQEACLLELLEAVGELSPYFENGMLDPYSIGLTVGGGTVTRILDCGLGRDSTTNLLERVDRAFGADKKIPKEANEAIRLVLLQQYYHLGNWSKGIDLIERTMNSGHVTPGFEREVAGFVTGMIKGGGPTNKACQVYANILSDSVRPSAAGYSQGDALMRLSHLYGIAGDRTNQLKVIKSVEQKLPDYYQSNYSTVHFFEFNVYNRMGDHSNSIRSLALAAKAYKENPNAVSDEVIRDQMPILLEQYQGLGYIDDEIEVVPFDRVQPTGTVERRIVKSIIVVMLAVFNLGALAVIIWRRKTSENTRGV